MANQKVNAVDVLRGCTKKWIEILTGGGMLEELQHVLDQATEKRFLPPAADMFTFARHSLADARVVILAMDPYPQPDQAHGLAFSSRQAVAPTILARIWNVLKANDLITRVPGTEEQKPGSIPICKEPNNLTHWAAQGIVLLNCALTVEENKPGAHIAKWQPWMDRMLTRLSLALPADTIWCLWGSDAQRKAPLIDARHTILRHCHPVAMQTPSDNGTNVPFASCDHFLQISKRWPGICWDPRKTETHYFTDCSARNNQSKTCRASWGVVCTQGLMSGRSWGGETLTKMIMQKGVKQPTEARPTNIRGEGEALIRAMQLAASLPRNTPAIIHTDSKFWAVDMLTRYIPDWMERGAKFTSKANSDLAEQMWTLYQAQEARGDCRLQFVHCWHDRDRPKEGTQDLQWWIGNRAAERRAEEVLGL